MWLWEGTVKDTVSVSGWWGKQLEWTVKDTVAVSGWWGNN